MTRLERPASNPKPSVAGFRADRSGSVAVISAFSALVMLIVSGFAVDYGMLVFSRGKLQSIADIGALAGAKELSLTDARRDNVPEIVAAIVEQYIKASSAKNNQFAVTTDIRRTPLAVEVSVRETVPMFFGRLLGMESTEIRATSVAQIIGRPNICVLALEKSEPDTIHLASTARLTGTNCAVFSNSTSSRGIAVDGGAALTATAICTAGGTAGQGKFEPPALEDCPRFEDPLASRPEPQVSGCDYFATVVAGQTRTLRPGVYCLGLTILGTAKVTFEPGLYIIKDGPFLVAGASEITGHGVGFYLTGAAIFTFDPLTRIELSAPTSGPLAGLLIFGSRSQSPLLINTVLSDRAHIMTGTIYLPRTTLLADSLARIGSQSAYTAIVARRLTLLGGPHLVLNTRYSDTDVPVPDGIKGVAQPIAIVK